MKNALILLLVLVLGCSTKADNLENNFRNNLLDLHNEQRINYGLKPLVLNEELCKYAQKHCEKMALKNSLYHSNINNIGKIDPNKNWNYVGENVAWGQKTESEVVNDWMWSPGHRWNILEPSYDEVGFGLAKDNKGRNYWCVVFLNKEV